MNSYKICLLAVISVIVLGGAGYGLGVTADAATTEQQVQPGEETPKKFNPDCGRRTSGYTGCNDKPITMSGLQAQIDELKKYHSTE